MSTPAQEVRRQVRAARELRGWDQIHLAKAAGVSRGTVQRLERGFALTEGKESRIERVLGWKIGSLDRIRGGGEPISEAAQNVPPTDPEERAIYDSMFPLPHEERMATVRHVMESRRHRGTGT